MPTGPITLDRMREAWPEVLSRLEDISRTSWMLASGARLLSLDGDVLTVAFGSQSDVAKFKQLAAGKGPSEDLRQAILAVLGIRVKYIARHDPSGGRPGGAPGGGAGGPNTDTRPPAPSGPAASAPPAPPARPTARTSAPYSAAPVTEWAVAPIPASDDGPSASLAAPPAQFAVDDEPEEAAAAPVRTATIAPVREGDVLPRAVLAPPVQSEDDDELDSDTDAAADAPVPPTVAPPIAPVVTRRNDGVQRYGEAVVRQVLGATFVREEPYQPPTRFN